MKDVTQAEPSILSPMRVDLRWFRASIAPTTGDVLLMLMLWRPGGPSRRAPTAGWPWSWSRSRRLPGRASAAAWTPRVSLAWPTAPRSVSPQSPSPGVQTHAFLSTLVFTWGLITSRSLTPLPRSRQLTSSSVHALMLLCTAMASLMRPTPRAQSSKLACCRVAGFPSQGIRLMTPRTTSSGVRSCAP